MPKNCTGLSNRLDNDQKLREPPIRIAVKSWGFGLAGSAIASGAQLVGKTYSCKKKSSRVVIHCFGELETAFDVAIQASDGSHSKDDV